MSQILNDSGWISFLERKHGLKHARLTAGDEQEGAAFASIDVFVNERGQLRTPRLMPYMPVYFRPTPTTSIIKLQRQWLTLAGELAREMGRLGYGGAIALDPLVADVRPWQWQAVEARVRYTMRISLPSSTQNYSHATRKQIRKAERAGYVTELSNDHAAIIGCLTATEDRQSFGYGLTIEDLDYLSGSMKPGTLRAYLTRDSSGDPASARVVLAPVGGIVIDLVAGTTDQHLRIGATQLTIAYALEDLGSYGATCFDYGGANMESVAASKMEWGCELTPFYSIRPLAFRTVAQDSLRWIKGSVGKRFQ